MGDVQVSSVTFLAEDVLQIQYSEEREVTKAAAMMRSIIIDTEFLEDGELNDLVSLVEDIIDKALLLIRNPPQVSSKEHVSTEDD